MYSYEERVRAVKRYIKHGKRTGLTIRQLGYPTKNSLKGWYREYERNRDLQVVYARSRVKYTAEQIQVAVQHYLDHDCCIASTLKALGTYAGTYSLDGSMNSIHSCVVVWWAVHPILNILRK